MVTAYSYDIVSFCCRSSGGCAARAQSPGPYAGDSGLRRSGRPHAPTPARLCDPAPSHVRRGDPRLPDVRREDGVDRGDRTTRRHRAHPALPGPLVASTAAPAVERPTPAHAQAARRQLRRCRPARFRRVTPPAEHQRSDAVADAARAKIYAAHRRGCARSPSTTAESTELPVIGQILIVVPTPAAARSRSSIVLWCAGTNRQGVVDESSIQRRRSEPLCPPSHAPSLARVEVKR